MRGLFWFREDLRLHDNPALMRLVERCDELILVYCFDDSRLRPGHFQAKGIGAPRLAFLQESLQDLAASVSSLSQHLLIRRGKPVDVIAQLIRRYSVDCLGVTITPGTHEQHNLERLLRSFPQLYILEDWSHTLFDDGQLPFELNQLPQTFGNFRLKVEGLQPAKPLPPPDYLPPRPLITRLEQDDPLPPPLNPYHHEWVPPHWFCFRGGESAAQAQLHHFLWDQHPIEHYQRTRNGFVGWQYSSKLAPWLAHGCLSARHVWQGLATYEARHGSDSNCHALRNALLWREYCQWLLFRHGNHCFRFSGIRGKRRLLTFYPEAFMAWTQGTTGIPIVDACMRELKTTGWLSNRGRHLVANFLVNELMIDWRFGAAWFEQQLIDFDVASNYNNWNAIADIGVPPQEQVGTDILQQAYAYDPDAEYVSLWLPELQSLPASQRHTPFWADHPVRYRCPIIDVSGWQRPT